MQHAIVLKFAAQLSAKGMTPVQMGALATAADQLAAAELAQELLSANVRASPWSAKT